MKKRALTGVQATGTLHIGNYVGALRPVMALAANPAYDTNIFIADYHALNNAEARREIRRNSYSIAATYLALGLDADGCTFYRQSDVPETFELTSFLTNFTPKGLMNRAHAYNAAVQEINGRNAGIITETYLSSKATGPDFKIVFSPRGTPKRIESSPGGDLLHEFQDADAGVNMGLYLYPLLMTADILLFDADVVPVGHDQKQHIEFARDIAGSVNAAYGQELLKLPEGLIAEATAELPGLDGRKMSKSYGNTIPIFAPRAELEKVCMKVKTDSKAPADPKDTDSLVYKLYSVVAGAEAAKSFHDRFIPGGMGYGQAKKELFELLDTTFGPARERYEALMQDTDKLDAILERGAVKARARASETMKRVRAAAGFKA